MEVISEPTAADSRLLFGIADYVIFSAMLLGCVAIGVYFGFFKVAVNAEQYLLGGRRLAMFPVAVSLVASSISGITLLGTPTELYLRGTQYVFINVSFFTASLFIGFTYLPVFHGLRMTSNYEYLEMRFGKSARLLGSSLFIVGVISWIPIVMYVPALAFNQVTGINVHIVTPIVCAVCIFYTCVGGLKAVVWTDVIQSVLMFMAVILVIVKGSIDVGGLGTVWQRNMDSGRIELPDLGFELTARHSWFGFLVGNFFGWLPLGVSQMTLQRFASVESLPKARMTMWVFIAGAMFLIMMSCYIGLLTYAVYHDCDPLITKQASAKDQLLPLLVMQALQDLPGLPGIFVAGIFSAALSSMSTSLNSVSAVVLEDFFKTFYGQDALSERQTDILLKSVVVIFGVLCTSLVFVVEKLGTVLQLSMSLDAMTNGPVLGVFTAGMFLPWVNIWGAILGGLAGLIFMGWVVLGSQAVMAAGLITIPSKPVSIAGCSAELLRHLNITAITAAANSTVTADAASSVLPIYRVSYVWYTMMGLVVTLVSSLAISLVTGKRDLASVDRSLVTPLMRWVLPEGRRASAARVDRVRSSISTYEGYKVSQYQRSASKYISAVKVQVIFTDEQKKKEEA